MDVGAFGGGDAVFRVPATENQIAWAAGLFEGEGTMHCRPQGKRGSGAQLRIAMRDGDVIERFRLLMGCGGIYIHKPGKPGHSPCPTWYVYEAEKVVAILECFVPWFGERRRAKALEVLEVARAIKAYGKRSHCPRGHAYEGDNLVVETIVRGDKRYLHRRCKICRTEQARERARKRRGSLPERFRV